MNAAEKKFKICVENNDFDAIKKLIDNGVHLRIQGPIALNTCAKEGYIKIFSYIIDNYNNAYFDKLDIKSILNIALQYTQIEIVQFILERYKEIEFDRSIEGYICRDLQLGKFSLINYLVFNHKDKIEPFKYNIMVNACEYGRLDIIEHYINMGIDINHKDGIFLINATKSGNISLVNFLLERKIDIKPCASSLLKESIEYGHLLILKKYFSIPIIKEVFDNSLHTEDNTFLMYALRNPNKIIYIIDVIRHLVQLGSNPSIALQNKAVQENIDLVNFLIDKGADIYSDNASPIFLVVQYKNLEVMKLIIKRKGNICFQDNICLSVAAMKGDYKMVDLLLENGAIYNHQLSHKYYCTDKNMIPYIEKKTLNVELNRQLPIENNVQIKKVKI